MLHGWSASTAAVLLPRSSGSRRWPTGWRSAAQPVKSCRAYSTPTWLSNKRSSRPPEVCRTMQLVSGWSDFGLSGMNVTVRHAAVGGTMGVRTSVYALTAAEVEALREAFLAVMGLRDERGYQYLSLIHI